MLINGATKAALKQAGLYTRESGGQARAGLLSTPPLPSCPPPVAFSNSFFPFFLVFAPSRSARRVAFGKRRRRQGGLTEELARGGAPLHLDGTQRRVGRAGTGVQRAHARF